MTSKEFFSVKDISLSFSGREHLLIDVSFNIGESEIISIIGKSGSGKTTLLNIISGLQPFDKGLVTFNEINLNKPINDISYLSQNPLLLYYKTGLENALMSAEIRKQSNQNITNKTIDLFELFNIKDSLHKFPNELSGGMKQRIGIIQSIIVKAKLYLLDEPLTSIDRTSSLLIENYLWNFFRQQHLSAIFVTHDLEQAISISDRILLLSTITKNIGYEFRIDENFVKLSPDARRKSEKFSEHLYELIKRFGEI